MKPRNFHNSRCSLLASAVATLLAAPAAFADTTTTAWNNAGTDWATAANWAGGAPSVTKSALFNSTFTNQPQLGTGTTIAQGLWMANGVGQDVTISTSDGITQRTLTITGTATLSGQANAGIILDDPGNHNLTIGGSSTDPLVVVLSNDTGFHVNNSGTLTFQGNKNLAIGARTLTLGGSNASGKIVISRAINGTGSVIVNTAGTVTLSGQNTLGGTRLTAGTLNINHAKALGTADATTFAIDGGTIDNTSANNIQLGQAYAINIGGNFAFTGTKDLSLGTGAVNLGAATRIITANAGILTIGGVISNGGLTKAGAGTLALSGVNTHTGDTAVTAGTLNLRNSNSLQNSVLNMNGGSVSFGTSTSSGLTAVALAGLSGSVNINLNNFLTTPTAVNLTIGNSNGQNADYSGALSNTNGNASLTKIGNNTQTLTGINTYSGATAVSNGTLAIASTGSINSSSSVTVAAGAKLVYNGSSSLTVGTTLNGSGTSNRAIFGGSGTINTTLTLDNVGDTLSPGNSPGIQTFTPAQTWNSFSYDWEVNDFSNVTGLTAGSDFDRIDLSNTLGLTGGFGSYTLNVLSLTAGNASGDVPSFSEINRSWTILTTTSGITGFNAANWTINTTGFTNGDTGTWALGQAGNDLVLSYNVVPEPRAALLGGLGLFVLLRRRRA